LQPGPKETKQNFEGQYITWRVLDEQHLKEFDEKLEIGRKDQDKEKT
jgi:hypothetical protein